MRDPVDKIVKQSSMLYYSLNLSAAILIDAPG